MKDIFDLIKEQNYSDLSNEELNFGKELFETEEEFNDLKKFLLKSENVYSIEKVSPKVKEDLDALFTESKSYKKIIIRYAAIAAIFVLGFYIIPFDEVQRDFSKGTTQLADNHELTQKEKQVDKLDKEPMFRSSKSEESKLTKQNEIKSDLAAQEKAVLKDDIVIQEDEDQHQVAIIREAKREVNHSAKPKQLQYDRVEKESEILVGSPSIANENRSAVSDKDGIFLQHQSANKYAVSLKEINLENDECWVAF